jgi:hypothetical protein
MPAEERILQTPLTRKVTNKFNKVILMTIILELFKKFILLINLS